MIDGVTAMWARSRKPARQGPLRYRTRVAGADAGKQAQSESRAVDGLTPSAGGHRYGDAVIPDWSPDCGQASVGRMSEDLDDDWLVADAPASRDTAPGELDLQPRSARCFRSLGEADRAVPRPIAVAFSASDNHAISARASASSGSIDTARLLTRGRDAASASNAPCLLRRSAASSPSSDRRRRDRRPR